MIKRLSSRGDTIIEVLLAMTLLTAILFTSWAIVNRSTQINLAARQRVVMVNQLKEQAEIIKSLYAEGKLESSLAAKSVTAVQAASISSNIKSDPCENIRDHNGAIGDSAPAAFYFYVDEESNELKIETGVKKLDSEAARIWVQRTDNLVPGSRYSDYYVRSCWVSGSGGTQREDNSHFIVRLNT